MYAIYTDNIDLMSNPIGRSYLLMFVMSRLLVALTITIPTKELLQRNTWGCRYTWVSRNIEREAFNSMIHRNAPRTAPVTPNAQVEVIMNICPMVCVIADFPGPAHSLTQHTGQSPLPLMHFTLSAITVLRVECDGYTVRLEKARNGRIWGVWN